MLIFLGTAEKIFPQYLEHIDAALEHFCNMHWPCEFIKTGGGGRCVNVRSRFAHYSGTSVLYFNLMTFFLHRRPRVQRTSAQKRKGISRWWICFAVLIREASQGIPGGNICSINYSASNAPFKDEARRPTRSPGCRRGAQRQRDGPLFRTFRTRTGE